MKQLIILIALSTLGCSSPKIQTTAASNRDTLLAQDARGQKEYWQYREMIFAEKKGGKKKKEVIKYRQIGDSIYVFPTLDTAIIGDFRAQWDSLERIGNTKP